MRQTPSLMPGIWQKLLIISVLALLVINGLPSFFGHQDVIKIDGASSSLISEKSPTFNQVMQQASELGLIITETQHNEQGANVEIRFTNAVTDAHAIQKTMQAELQNVAEITVNSTAAAPSWLAQVAAEPIKLGLDLSGGALFVLEVDTDTAMKERLENTVQNIKASIRAARVFGTRIVNNDDSGVTITFPKSSESRLLPVLNELVTQSNGLVMQRISAGKINLYYSPEKIKELTHQYVEQALTTMRGRIEQLGITEGVVQRQGKERIRIEIPGIKDLQQAERLIGATAGLAFHQFAEFARQQPSVSITDDNFGRLTLAAQPIFTGNNINDAQMGRDEQGVPLVNLVLDSQGGKKMSDFSRHNIGKPMVTLFSEYRANEQGSMQKSERVINVATIQAQLGNRFSITNLDSIVEAQDLAMLLRAGSLDAPVSIVEKRIINASLGEENVKNGMLALALGLALTLVFMLVFYRRLGLIANLALVFNLACLTGLMALTPNAVLTLPGIAGLVLTVGMAVDTNVLIFERIRYEQSKGVPPNLALILGYKHAWTTILDANLTTLICALVMLSIGYGPVKGFAITLTLGLLTSVFTGVAVSKTVSAYLPAKWLLSQQGEKA